jgi:acyl-coenzyme A thioesterase PaaI-like protein
MMALADVAAYYLVLASVGPVALAVTQHLSIHFLRKPPLADLLATADLLRLSKRQAVCTVEIHTEGDPDPVAHATVTYAIPAPPSAAAGATQL